MQAKVKGLEVPFSQLLSRDWTDFSCLLSNSANGLFLEDEKTTMPTFF